MATSQPIFDVGDQPFGRTHVQEMRCPFCGAGKLLNDDNDIADDSLRIEFYCENHECQVGTFTVLAIHIRQRNDRADVIALEEIDAGVGYERTPEIINAFDPEDMSLVDAHHAGRLHRRTREARIVVIPGDRYAKDKE